MKILKNITVKEYFNKEINKLKGFLEILESPDKLNEQEIENFKKILTMNFDLDYFDKLLFIKEKLIKDESMLMTHALSEYYNLQFEKRKKDESNEK